MRCLRYCLPKWISLLIDPSATNRIMGSYHFKKVVTTRSGTIPGYVVFRSKAQGLKVAAVLSLREPPYRCTCHAACRIVCLVLSISCQHDVIWEGARFHGNDGNVPAEDYSRLQMLGRVWRCDSACHAALSCKGQSAQLRLHLSMTAEMRATQRHDIYVMAEEQNLTC